MKNEKITTDSVADALISLCEEFKLCDKETALGFKTSMKKGILKSKKENSFSRFTYEIEKIQNKKR